MECSRGFGGGGGTSSAGAGVTTGAIQKFGSVWVNGVEFKTSTATHRRMLDDGPGDVPGHDNEVFKEGMVVTVHHGEGDDDADEIEYEDNLKGPVSGINPADNNVVEVSGLPDATGAIHATMVERKSLTIASMGLFEIKGFVINLNRTAKTFSLGQVPSPTLITVPVDFGGMMNLPTPVGDGVFVEVKTRSTTTPLSAVNIEPKKNEGDELEGAERVDIEGYPAAITPGTMSGTTLVATRIAFET